MKGPTFSEIFSNLNKEDSVKPIRPIEQQSPQELAYWAQEMAMRLRRMAAQGDAEAADGLFQIARTATGALAGLCRKHPETIRPVTRKCGAMPILSSPHPALGDSSRELFAACQLGEDYPFNIRTGRQWKPKSPGTKWAIMLHDLVAGQRKASKQTLDCLNRLRGKERKAFAWLIQQDGDCDREFAALGNFSKATASRWFEMADKYFIKDASRPLLPGCREHFKRDLLAAPEWKYLDEYDGLEKDGSKLAYARQKISKAMQSLPRKLPTA